MKRAGAVLAAIVVAGLVWAGGNGVGSGGLNGFPSLNNSPISPSSVTTPLINATTGNFAYVDAGVVNAGRVEFAKGNQFAPILYSLPIAPGYLVLDGGLQLNGTASFRNDVVGGKLSMGSTASETASIDFTTGAIVTMARVTAAEVASTGWIYAATYLSSGVASGSDGLSFVNEAEIQWPDTKIAEVGTALVVTAAGGFTPGASLNLTNKMDINTAPTLTGGCTSPTVTWSNGTALFQVDVGGTCAGISTIVLTLPTASNGWECKCTNITAPATRVIDSSAWSTTTVTVTNYSRTLGTAADFTDGTDLRCLCRGG